MDDFAFFPSLERPVEHEYWLPEKRASLKNKNKGQVFSDLANGRSPDTLCYADASVLISHWPIGVCRWCDVAGVTSPSQGNTA